VSAPTHPDAATIALRAWRREGGRLRLLVRGWSMAPLLQPGDGVELEPCPLAGLRPGAILVVQQDTGLLTHRLVRAERHALWLWGDGLPTPDAPVAPEALVGQVIARERGGRRLMLRGWHWERLGRAMVRPHGRRLVRLALTVALAYKLGATRP